VAQHVAGFVKFDSLSLSATKIKTCETEVFVGALAELLKATISFATSVRPSVLSSFRMQQLGSHWTDFFL
jgi:hypothetical protein